MRRIHGGSAGTAGTRSFFIPQMQMLQKQNLYSVFECQKNKVLVRTSTQVICILSPNPFISTLELS